MNTSDSLSGWICKQSLNVQDGGKPVRKRSANNRQRHRNRHKQPAHNRKHHSLTVGI
jgi:hypothetical protein